MPLFVPSTCSISERVSCSQLLYPGHISGMRGRGKEGGGGWVEAEGEEEDDGEEGEGKIKEEEEEVDRGGRV